jgi:hypothetical protein
MAMNVRNEIPLWARVIRTACSTAFAVSMVLFAALLTDVGGYRGGWAWAAMLFGTTGALTGWFGWGDGAGRPAVVTVLVVGGITFGLLLAEGPPYSAPRIKAQLDRIEAPEGFVKVGDERTGYGGCIGGCPAVARRWLVAGTLELAQRRITAALAAGGFELDGWEHREKYGGYSDEHAEGRRGKLRVTAIARNTASGGTPVVPENHVLVTVTMTS